MSIALTLDSFRQLCFELASHAAWIAEEPIPNFDTRYPGRLESCLDTPFQTFQGQPLYPTLMEQAAIFFYLLNKNHPFINGNKRLALTALLVFLFLNGKWLSVSPDQLYEFSISVAGSDARGKDLILEEIKTFLGQNMFGVLPTILGE
ncbi:MAG: type II toxin-antitoxin system death-on-curing family toxin [Acidobacteria bacterium]|nr:type II toxin-antitoxin system death-on-curing family toxin [Acidobacteriota bacterium]